MVTALHIRRSRKLSGLGDCTGLEILTLVGCDPVDLGQISGLPALRSLTIRDSGMTFAGISSLPLLSFYAPRNFVTDLSPLMNARRLANLDVTGNPLSEHSYREVIPRLVGRGCRVIASAELEWALTRRLHARGIPVSCYRKDGAYRLCRPGLGLTNAPEYAHPVIREGDIRILLDEDPYRVHRHFERKGT
ncbi:hypothetical protein OG705_29540 [Streptomyces sp. NBC_00838]|uniref:hypothetical protein n=1 Tax=Streptomyces sp. NBC_00838 TaxID=2903680 RepID=UPI0038708403|nr:hypothetical protein OG705_29540 [Streptomyces sp. NBC_00838]